MPFANPYESVLRRFGKKKIRYIIIGVSGINYYANDPGAMFSTQDCDVLVKPDPKNLLLALEVLAREGYRLESAGEPLVGADLWLARRIIERRAVITARKGKALRMDIVLDAGRIPYPEWEKGKRIFTSGRLRILVGGLPMLIRAKENSPFPPSSQRISPSPSRGEGVFSRENLREKDRKFLALYKIQLKEMLKEERSIS